MQITKNNNIDVLKKLFFSETDDEVLAQRIVSTLSTVDSSSSVHENISEEDVFETQNDDLYNKTLNVLFVEDEISLLNVGIDTTFSVPFYVSKLGPMIKNGETIIFCNPDIADKMKDSLTNLHTSFDLSRVSMYTLSAFSAINPDKTISKKKVYAGSAFALKTIQHILNENENFEYVSIVSCEAQTQVLKAHEMHKLYEHNRVKYNSHILCEISHISETSEYIPVCINGEKRIVKKSIVSDLDLFQEIQKADFACTGNFFVGKEFFGSFVDIPLKKVRQKKDKKILDHVYSDLFEQFYNCNFLISSLADKSNISVYFTKENWETIKNNV
jgi:hypothetical protein